MLVVDEVDYRRPRVTVIDVVAKPWRVDHSQLDLELLLFKFGLDDLDLRELVELLVMTATVVLRWRQLGGKQRVYECGLSETRLALKPFRIGNVNGQAARTHRQP